MSVLLLLLFGGFLFLGMFFLAADLLKVPYMKTEKALLDTGRNNKKDRRHSMRSYCREP